MKPDGTLPHSQVPNTCPYPEPHQSNPRPPSHFLKIHLNTILPSKLRSFKWSLQVGLSHEILLCTSPVSHTCHMPRPSHSSWLDPPNNICWGVKIMKLLVTQSSPLSCYLVPVRPNIFLSTLCRIPSAYVPPSRWKISFTPTQNNTQNCISIYRVRQKNVYTL